ncbi:MAG: prephenate dehydrogenase [Brevibacterium sp.]|uniref:prephenate dehydrogenase n=1 Tax=Brevibacterium sp. TaxID=1701 RepID=UPI002648D639|nr:prephenate dehydrogenase [Brevibacterium sp.]MDN5808288.1 prephenate dehydrogenase [Brevibacterium sp.]MDN6133906.1 prephenate dehydrogenase [Brevibacterium sp.]MDN6175672.1 prephenate dehydrogenase [Brevibacterium sp.]MDN6188516.1 prephenate dehydrogenase [Brevibacterium sp.]MDN6603993.1 prephenate dehydrogenase [Brevibacterium sp.]
MRIHIIGTGLLGASLGLALSAQNYQVSLEDTSPTAQQLAADLGAGRVLNTTSAGDAPNERAIDEEPQIVVVATPPDVAAPTIAAALSTYSNATVTDVASVKTRLLESVRELVAPSDLDRYIGCHPMAGREKSGAIAARSDLFTARPWVICSDEDTPRSRLGEVVTVAEATGASVIHLDPRIHDAAVAKVSHVPQVIASLVASQLRHAPLDEVALAGQGLRDVTRIAASDPRLWTQILAGNSEEVRSVLLDLRTELDEVITALELGPGSTGALAKAIALGNEGHDRIPGKHGQAPTKYAVVTILVPDTPGTLAILFKDIGDLNINVEDFRMDHAPGQKLGIVDVSVVPATQQELEIGLLSKGWQIPESAIEKEGIA